eukprot:c6780_g1_i1.p1 GENE.c6780_g1_i1~~c6780_g1_i1.p1  ORF type:complete len:429 (+),score=122.61 c6780_g1_i1:35-1321(+)
MSMLCPVSVHRSNGINVAPGSQIEIPISIQEPSVLSYKFRVLTQPKDEGANLDISFQLIGRFEAPLAAHEGHDDYSDDSLDSEDGETILVLAHRCAQEEGVVHVQGPGTCILSLDNSHSWFTSKMVWYEVLLAPSKVLGVTLPKDVAAHVQITTEHDVDDHHGHTHGDGGHHHSHTHTNSNSVDPTRRAIEAARARQDQVSLAHKRLEVLERDHTRTESELQQTQQTHHQLVHHLNELLALEKKNRSEFEKVQIEHDVQVKRKEDLEARLNALKKLLEGLEKGQESEIEVDPKRVRFSVADDITREHARIIANGWKSIESESGKFDTSFETFLKLANVTYQPVTATTTATPEHSGNATVATSGTTSPVSPKNVPTPAPPVPAASELIIPEESIEMVMVQTGAGRPTAVKALQENHGDVVNAIMALAIN